MTQKDSEDQLTLFAAAILASPSRLPGSDEAIKMTDTSGRKCLELSKLSGRLGLLEKMLLDTSLWASTRCYLTWKPKDTKQGALLFRLSPQMPTTAEKGVGLLHTPTAKANQLAPSMNSGWNEPLWATPNTMDHLPQRSDEALKKQATTSRKGRARPANLREQVDPETVRKWQQAQEPVLWATPSASSGEPPKRDDWTWTGLYWIDHKGEKKQTRLKDQAQMYPTPAARDYKEMSGKGRQERKGNPKDTLPNAVGGSLNPQWVEWLMGYPVGYTDLGS
jgi:hypothetical protein